MKTAEQAFEEYAAKFNTLDNEWQDMGADQYFTAGYAAALAVVEKLCEEMETHYHDYAATALLNGDVELSNAASGEPRACRFIAERVRGMR
jgi:hypothetical protein